MLAPGRLKTGLSRGVLLLIITSLCWALSTLLTGAPITKDARQNLRAAYNLSAWGVFSIEASGEEKPAADNYREPVVPFVTSLLIRLYEKSGEDFVFEDFSAGSMCRAIKKINLFWAFFLLLGSAVLVVLLTGSSLFAGLCVVLIWLSFLRNPAYIDTLCTEIPTATIMIWVSVVLVRSLRSCRPLLFCCAGLLFGALCLAKAVFLYLAAPIVLLIFLWNLKACSAHKLRAFSGGVLFLMGIAIVTGPWMLRNHGHFGNSALTLRGGTVLYGRALRNTMHMGEVVAAFYVWGPGVYRKMVKNTFLDMSSEDYQEGGRAARLNRSSDAAFENSDKMAEKAARPQDAISFHRKSRAERFRIIRYYESLGHPQPEQAADAYLKREARQWILEHPVRHVIMTVPFAWRGVWCFYGGGIFTVLNALCYSSFLVLIAYALFRKRGDALAFAVLPGCMLFFNAFLSHNLSRYSSPAIPYLIISLPFIISIKAGRAVEKNTAHGRFVI